MLRPESGFKVGHVPFYINCADPGEPPSLAGVSVTGLMLGRIILSLKAQDRLLCRLQTDFNAGLAGSREPLSSWIVARFADNRRDDLRIIS